MLGRNANGPYEQLRELVPEPFDALPEEVRAFLQNYSKQEYVPPNLPEVTQRRTTRSRSLRRPDAERLLGKALEMVPQSGRNNSGFWLACQLRDNGYSSEEAESAMRDYRCQVPSSNTKGKREAYTEPEMKASLREAYSKPAREPWALKRACPHTDSAPAAAPGREPARRVGGESLPEKEAPAQGDVADVPESIGLYVGHTGEPLVGHTGEPLPRAAQFSRVPREVAEDCRLKHRDVRVYAALAASCWQGNVSHVGKRKIAKLAPCAERLVIDSLRRLEATGHIQKCPRRRGQRGRYVLSSAVFGQKQRADLEESTMGPNGRLHLVTVRKDQGTAKFSRPRSPAGRNGTDTKLGGRS